MADVVQSKHLQAAPAAVEEVAEVLGAIPLLVGVVEPMDVVAGMIVALERSVVELAAGTTTPPPVTLCDPVVDGAANPSTVELAMVTPVGERTVAEVVVVTGARTWPSLIVLTIASDGDTCLAPMNAGGLKRIVRCTRSRLDMYDRRRTRSSGLERL